MKKVNLNFAFKGLDGVEMIETNAGKSLGQALASATKGDPIKHWSLAKRMYDGEILEVDESDLTLVKEFVKSSEGFTALAKAQMLDVLNNAEEVVKEVETK